MHVFEGYLLRYTDVKSNAINDLTILEVPLEVRILFLTVCNIISDRGAAFFKIFGTDTFH